MHWATGRCPPPGCRRPTMGWRRPTACWSTRRSPPRCSSACGRTSTTALRASRWPLTACRACSTRRRRLGVLLMPPKAAPWRMRHFIDLNKGATMPCVLLLMALYGAWGNPVIWLYGAEHGLYGLLWVCKTQLFPDRQFEQPVTFFGGLQIWVVLCLYWVTPWLIVSRDVQVAPWYAGLSVLLFGSGVFLHFVADMQKSMHLRYRPGTLLTDGLWRRSRNPNYFGELLIYCGFASLGRHWAPFALLALMMLGVWLPNMRRKDASLSRYPDFAAWKAHSGLLFFRLLPGRASPASLLGGAERQG
ncbi:MAG: DUF1295 domain-containing protein [Deltaproteobacteria bacterium]|nr:MAG: DUF1295 domain-containing protein [Deltaproteobacteria bacterium]